VTQQARNTADDRAGDVERGRPGAAFDTAIECRGVCKAYAPRRRGEPPVVALSEIDLEVRSGEFAVIVGPSGCGKSTLLNIMAGVDTASVGTVTVSPTVRRRAYVFQKDTLLPWRSLRRNIELGLRGSGKSKEERQHAVQTWTDRVGLSAFANSYPSQLSGGMRRRAALATAFAHEPEILFMDEPFGSVDAQTRLQLQDELLRLWEGDRRTVVFITHDIEEALLLGDRVIVMSSRPGRIIDEIRVDLPRPRTTHSVRFDPVLAKMSRQIWDELHA
jgi:NitT/TauT family transport system ATP-binding protein